MELNLDGQSTFQAVKNLLANKLDVPLSCQRLICGETLVSEADIISKHASDKDATCLSLSLIITTDKVSTDLLSIDSKCRLQAVKDLGRLGRRGGQAPLKKYI